MSLKRSRTKKVQVIYINVWVYIRVLQIIEILGFDFGSGSSDLVNEIRFQPLHYTVQLKKSFKNVKRYII